MLPAELGPLFIVCELHSIVLNVEACADKKGDALFL